MSDRKQYHRGVHYSLTRAMLGEEAAEHGFRVAERMLNDRSRRINWHMALLGQMHDWAEDTDLSVQEVAETFLSTLWDHERSNYTTAVETALRAVTRRQGEVYADFIDRVCGSSSLAVRIKLADVRDNLERADASEKGDLRKRYTVALDKLERAEAAWVERERDLQDREGTPNLCSWEYAKEFGHASEEY